MSNFVNFYISEFIHCFKTISWASSFTIRSINSLIVPSLTLYYFRLLWARCTVPYIILYCFFNKIQFTGYQGVAIRPYIFLFLFYAIRDTRYCFYTLHLFPSLSLPHYILNTIYAILFY